MMLQRGKFNVVVDGQWGSCGKGLINTAIAYKERPEIISTTNMANAGHTAQLNENFKFVAKILPSSAILRRWACPYDPDVYIGPSAAFTIDQFLKEVRETGTAPRVHRRAAIITRDHQLAESADSGPASTKHLASTMQGCGAALAEKIMRKPGCILAGDYRVMDEFICRGSMPRELMDRLCSFQTILHEGSQGFSLDINHGSHYPFCTSRQTTATQCLADMGLPVDMMGEIILVIRPYPIRVGNVIENGVTKGRSGGCYDDQEETSWNRVAEMAGAPADIAAGELTTVTKRLRRVFTFSMTQLREAVLVNGATQIALNFANYIDWRCFGQNNWASLPDQVLAFAENIQRETGCPVTMIGTGPMNHQVAFLDPN